jgi:hypothetical protein
MNPEPLLQTVAQIAEHERKAAVMEGDYVWAIICAIVEGHALRALS